jgi:uncharacterized protein (TIGR00645 family)
MEKLIEKALFASRWLLAPIYLGMSLMLVALGVKFFAELLHVAMDWNTITEAGLVLKILGMIDMALVGSLIVMVTFSSYENFVSRIEVDGEGDKLGWLGKLDANSLKLKVAVSIVAISSIHLLQKFVDAEKIANEKLMWYVIMHMTFVLSAVLMGVLDKMSFAAHREH